MHGSKEWYARLKKSSVCVCKLDGGMESAVWRDLHGQDDVTGSSRQSLRKKKGRAKI